MIAMFWRRSGDYARSTEDAAGQMGASHQHFEPVGNHAAVNGAGLFGLQGGHERNDGFLGEGGRGRWNYG
jgi:hypothetical protein